MRVSFWGVRGSIPSPGPGTVRYGGNTSCVSADFGDEIVIFDAGTGLRILGDALLKRSPRPRIHLFLSHVHWDHIQGFPFFAPAYTKDFTIDVYGRGHADQTLGQILHGQMERPNFPVTLTELDANLTYHDIEPGQTLFLNGDGKNIAKVHGIAGNHPNGVLCYRLENLRTHHSLVYATDTEHVPGRLDERLAELGKDADMLIYDGMYTPDEYEKSHQGWGHSTWEQGLAIAIKAGIRKYVVFHHDPSHDDAFLDDIETTVMGAARASSVPVEAIMAREGLSIDL